MALSKKSRKRKLTFAEREYLRAVIALEVEIAPGARFAQLGQIAKHVDQHASSACRTLGRLVKMDLVERMEKIQGFYRVTATGREAVSS